MQNKIIKNQYNTKGKCLSSILFFLAIIGCLSCNSILAADELSGIMTSARENFGAGSTFIKLLYGAEIIAGGYAWHKTKHPSAVIGIVILTLFMTYALGHWVFV